MRCFETDARNELQAQKRENMVKIICRLVFRAQIQNDGRTTVPARAVPMHSTSQPMLWPSLPNNRKLKKVPKLPFESGERAVLLGAWPLLTRDYAAPGGKRTKSSPGSGAAAVGELGKGGSWVVTGGRRCVGLRPQFCCSQQNGYRIVACFLKRRLENRRMDNDFGNKQKGTETQKLRMSK
ncbi:hypothetical protein N656DRAFT_297741 [Canariomyces notabilis]|uniref:Uncharacterized protein n=1 Tax=Canariomyces notabilis TaxID=2074819 RepID=A0AAN6QH11_9PEZI|nr:hypothetical protein N656DRAFT_297741 [Canariomyces arenarius]